ICVSETQSEVLRDKISNMSIIYNGVEIEEIPFSEQKEDYLLFVGRLDPNKGADIALRAAIKANQKIIIVGKKRERDPISEEYFANKVEPLLSHKLVTHIPEVQHHELYAIYKSARALIFPLTDPRKEAFGLVSAEAMASGTPVIGLDNSLMREIVDHGKT